MYYEVFQKRHIKFIDLLCVYKYLNCNKMYFIFVYE